jgi:hypothetical protein
VPPSPCACLPLAQGARRPSELSRRPAVIYALLILFAILNIGDGLSTLKFLSEGHREGNALARRLFDKIGVVPTIILLKTLTVVVVAGCALLALHIAPEADVWIALFLAALCGVLAYTIIGNLD